jgi:hypothetical protein
MTPSRSTKQVGELKSSSAAGSINGAGGAGINDSVPTAANSATSTPTAKPPTKRGASTTPGMRLEILQQAAIDCQNAGISCQVAQLHGAENTVALVLRGVVLVNGNLMIADIGTGVP